MWKLIKIKDVAKKSGLEETALREAFLDQWLIEEKDAKFVEKNKVIYFSNNDTWSRKIMFYEALSSWKVAYLALAFLMLAWATSYFLASWGEKTFNTASYESVFEQLENDSVLLEQVKETYCK